MAACSDTFSNAFVRADTNPALNPQPAFAYQNLFPLGVGASLNAVVSTMNTVNTAFLSPSSSFVSAKGDRRAGPAGRRGVGTCRRRRRGDQLHNNQHRRHIEGEEQLIWPGNAVPVVPITGTGTCKGTIHEDYFGYQFGFDLANLNIGGNGGNFHFGLTAGYISSRSKDVTGAAHNLRTLGIINYDFEVSLGKLQR